MKSPSPICGEGLFVAGRSCESTSFNDIGTVQAISFTFNQPNWDYHPDTAKAGADGYILAVRQKLVVVQ